MAAALVLGGIAAAGARDRWPSAAAGARGQDPGGGVALERATRLLEREIPLARAGRPYLVLDLPEGWLELKAQGVALRHFPVRRWSALPPPALATGPHVLTGRDALRMPARPVQQVGSPSATPGGEEERLSVLDMPAAYNLSLGPAIRLFVFGEPPASARERLLGLAAGVLYRVRAAAARLATWAGRPAPAVIRIWLSADDARGLFWSLHDGLPVLIGGVAP